MVRVQQRLGVSERRACEVLGQARSTQRRSRKRGADEAALRADVVKVAGRFGRYGYRMVTGMLRAEGWVVNHKRVERIWREEGLKVPKKQPKRGRLWLTDGSCIRLRPLYRHHVWAYDFVADRTHDGRPLKMLTVLDEYSRECLAIVVARRLRADDVLQTLSELFVEHGPPANLRSDNGPEFTAKVVREWLERVEVKTLYIEPGSPWENGYNESFNGTLGEEVLKREIFYSLEEAAVLVEQWRREYNTIRPHSSLRYRPPAPEALRPDPFFLNLPKLNGPSPQASGGRWTNTVGGTTIGGRSPPGIDIDMYGPDEGLTYIEARFRATDDSNEQYWQGLLAVKILEMAFPDWQSREEWLERVLFSGEDGTLVRDGREISVARSGPYVYLIVSPSLPT